MDWILLASTLGGLVGALSSAISVYQVTLAKRALMQAVVTLRRDFQDHPEELSARLRAGLDNLALDSPGMDSGDVVVKAMKATIEEMPSAQRRALFEKLSRETERAKAGFVGSIVEQAAAYQLKTLSGATKH